MKALAKQMTRFFSAAFLAAALLLTGGCGTRVMKGSPFYTGDYAVNVPGAELRRLNLWPLTYYREPALSVLWPVFERTEEHLAVRPLFSAYGDTQSYWEYNVLWPLAQADTKERDYRIFPYFWGEGTRDGGIKQDYHVLFPFVWHYEDETLALFPLWISDRGGWRDGRFTERDCWLGWPLTHLHTGEREEAWRAALFGRYRYLDKDETYTGYPWPLLFSWQTKETRGLFTPLYAYGESDKGGVRDGWTALPLLLSWHRWQRDDNDLNALLGLYNRHWSDSNSSGYLIPFCAYDRQDRMLLTPLVGWDKPDAEDPDGYWYPFTPLAGVYTGTERGGWLFPLFSHASNATNDTYSNRCLLLGYAKHTRNDARNRTSSRTEFGFFPLFSHSLNTFTNRMEHDDSSTAGVNQYDRQLLVSYSDRCETVCRAPTGDTPCAATNRLDTRSVEAWKAKKARGDTRTVNLSEGTFPLWSATSRLETRLDGARLREDTDTSLLLALYDTRRKYAQDTAAAKPLDYVRRRILWRLWHYERRNGDVSVDVFPSITYDTRPDGFSKTSFLWRLYRYERHADGGVDLDLLFLPLRRAR